MTRLRKTDRQTDGRTGDGQTDKLLIARPRLHSMQRGDYWHYYWNQSRFEGVAIKCRRPRILRCTVFKTT